MNLTRVAALGAIALVCAPIAAPAQTYRDSGGTIVPGFVPLGGCVAGGNCAGPSSSSAPIYVVTGPYPFTPLTPGQHNLAPTSATGLTIPTGARYATACASTATVKYTTDGTTTPTSSVGMPLAAGACVALSGASVLANFKAISATGTLDVEYFQ